MTMAAKLSRATKRFGRFVAVDDIDLNAQPGRVLALLGRNGAGKTTALRCLLGILRLDGGIARLFGSDPRSRGVQERVGYQSQSTFLHPLIRVDEAIRCFASHYRKGRDVDQTLLDVGLSHRVTSAFGTLSGGERQRLGLAMALVGTPELLVLDEPTSGLDVSGRQAVWKLLRSFVRDGMTIVMATHLLEEVIELADDVVVMSHARIAASGSIGSIAKEYGGALRIRFDASEAAAYRVYALEDAFKREGLEASARRSELIVYGALADSAIVSRILREASGDDALQPSLEPVEGSVEAALRHLTGAIH